MIAERQLTEFNRVADIDSNRIQEEDVSTGAEVIKDQRVAVIFPRGEVIRNFVYTGMLDVLGAESELHLLTVAPGEEFEEMLASKCDSIYPLTEADDKWIVRIQRDIIDTAHNRWIWSRAAKERSRLRDQEAQTVRQKIIRRIKKMISFPVANRGGLNALSSLERISSRLFRTSNQYTELYKKIRPDLVFNASHVHSRNATQAVEAAQWLGIPTATFIFSWDNLTSQGRIMLPYEYYLVWNEDLKKQLLEMYEWINPENVFITGTPQFDYHFQDKYYLSKEEYCEEIGADPNRPIVLYATGMANHMPGEPDIVEGIADVLAEFPEGGEPQLVLRVYAKDLTGRFEELRQRRPDIIFADPLWEPAWLTPKYEDSYALINALRHCSLGINVASTVSLELCMFDKPVINVGYNPPSVPEQELSYADYYEFDHYKPVVESGAVQVAWSIAEMRQLIKSSLTTPEQQKNERKKLIDHMFGSTLDGMSAHRVAKALLEVCQTESDRS
ncbi:MAG: hypothetical protein IPL32_08645 [Chloracidobacterium sp.]|nr:hypothetical protein [Chloracidobacterium sp.]